MTTRSPRIYVNDNDPYVLDWARELMKRGIVPHADIDDRSIRDVSPADVADYDQCHFFCGILGWLYALRQAGWPKDQEVWTGSAPCQPFSVAGKQQGKSDPRHLWPDFFRLIDACRPARLFGEQVSGKAGYGWLDGVFADLESKDYTCWAYDIPACAVDAPHIRNRLYWGASLADGNVTGWGSRPKTKPEITDKRLDSPSRGYVSAVEHSAFVGRREGWPEPELRRGWDALAGADASGAMGDADLTILEKWKSLTGDACAQRASAERTDDASFWSDAEWIVCHDGKARRTKPGLSLLAPRSSNRISLWRGLGNGLCVPLAIEVVKAVMESEGL